MCISVVRYDFCSSHRNDYSHCLSLRELQLRELQSLIIWYCSRRKWRAHLEADLATPAFDEWVSGAIRSYAADDENEVDVDTLLLCTKPSQRTIRYAKMRAFGHHFRVDDEAANRLQMYNSGIASIFNVPTEDARDVSVNYVGVVKNILKLNYGALHNPVILLRCEWIKREDNRGNPTYLRDEAGFLVVNSRHKLPSMLEPFIFLSQATQVFFSDDPRKPGWKVILSNAPRAKREVADTSNVFITTSVETTGLTAPAHVSI
jgi:hypothetical protein